MTRRAVQIAMTHGLHEDICMMTSERAALIYNRIAFYIEGNAINDAYRHNGQYFARATASDLLDVFAWLNEDQIKYAIKQLLKAKILVFPVGADGAEINLGKNAWHRGRWFGYGPKSPQYSMVEKSTVEGEEVPDREVEKSTVDGGESAPTISNTFSDTSSHTQGGVCVDEAKFEDFIAAYPEGTGGLAAPARAVFDKLSVEDQCDAIEAAQALPRRFKEYPAVWLKSRGWTRPAPTVKAAASLPTRPDDPDMARIYDCFERNGKLSVWQNWLSPQHVSVVDGVIRPSTVFIQSQLRSQAKFHSPLKALGYTIGDVLSEAMV